MQSEDFLKEGIFIEGSLLLLTGTAIATVSGVGGSYLTASGFFLETQTRRKK